MTEPAPIAIGVDVGGSGIKAAAIDTSRGTLVSERIRVPTPTPSTPAAVIAAILRIVRRIEGAMGRPDLPIGVDFPSVILDGKTMTAANVDQEWVGYPAVEHLERAIGRPVTLVNDADAAGLAEMRFGAGVGHVGVVLVLTLGTGVGSGLFVDGILVPNTELGHMEIRGRDAERRSAAVARIRRAISWKTWAADLDEHLQAIDRILWPDLIILGGGVSKNADRFIPRLTCRPPVVPAVLRNEAGMVGAAMFAIEHQGIPTVASGTPTVEPGTPTTPAVAWSEAESEAEAEAATSAAQAEPEAGSAASESEPEAPESEPEAEAATSAAQAEPEAPESEPEAEAATSAIPAEPEAAPMAPAVRPSPDEASAVEPPGQVADRPAEPGWPGRVSDQPLEGGLGASTSAPTPGPVTGPGADPAPDGSRAPGSEDADRGPSWWSRANPFR